MNINFEDIITKANKRKDDLVALTALLGQAPEMLTELKLALAWLDAVVLAFGALDQEGRHMLPGAVHGALGSTNTTRAYLRKVIWDTANGDGVEVLVRGAEV